MARAKTSEQSRSRSKALTIEELTNGIVKLKEFLAQVEDMGRDGFPYLDAARARTELQLHECIRNMFGEKSKEFQELQQHRFLMDSPEHTQQGLTLIKALIAAIEQKKRDLQEPPPQQMEAEQAAPPIPPHRQMTLVPTSISTVQMTMTQTGSITPPSVAMAVAKTTNLGLAPATAVPSPLPAPAASSQKPETVSPSPTQTVPAMPPIPPHPVVQVAPEPQLLSQTAQTVRADLSHAGSPPHPQQGELTPIVQPTPSASPQPQMQEAPPVPSHLQLPPAVPVGSPSHQEPAPQSPQAVSDSIERVKTLCCRFHSVARQLRLRGEYRATLSVEDEFDARDLLHALLRIEFDNIDTDEWTPSYSSGARHTTLLLNESRLAVIVKKTRSGLSIKDLTDQLQIDAVRYRYHGRCTTLLCFMYDPDGRIGNPRGFETSVTSVSNSFVVEVLVAPK